MKKARKPKKALLPEPPVEPSYTALRSEEAGDGPFYLEVVERVDLFTTQVRCLLTGSVKEVTDRFNQLPRLDTNNISVPYARISNRRLHRGLTGSDTEKIVFIYAYGQLPL